MISINTDIDSLWVNDWQRPATAPDALFEGLLAAIRSRPAQHSTFDGCPLCPVGSRCSSQSRFTLTAA